jgi:hypothetical protein
MKKIRLSNIIVALSIIFPVVAGYSCSGRYLKTENAGAGEITGSYTLILYGGTFPNDLSTIAVLAKEGTPYSFDVFAPEFDYKVIKAVPAKEALEKAEKFVSFHHDFWKVQLSKIIDKNGTAIGYEVRPLYNPAVYSNYDIPDVYYKISGVKVIVYIRFYEHPDTFFPLRGSMTLSPR